MSTTQNAIASRVVIVLLQLVANHLIPDHDAGVFVSPNAKNVSDTSADRVIEFTLSGFRRWDAEYFLHIAEHGYIYENSLAFYPLFPFVVRTTTEAFHFLLPEAQLRNQLLLIAVILNVLFFILTAKILHRLTLKVFNRDVHFADATVLLFCVNPASVFFTAPYTECLFTLSTFSLMLCFAERRFICGLISLMASIACRSNGTLNFGFIAYYLLRDVIYSDQNVFCALIKNGLKWIVSLIAGLITFFVIHNYFFHLFCSPHTSIAMEPHIITYATDNHFVVAGTFNRSTISNQSPWCHYSVPISYGYVQSHYWNVGFLKYYEWKQLPNFALAAPIMIFIPWNCIKFILCHPRISWSLGLSRTPDSERLVYIAHAIFLSIFCIFFVHVQVSIRMIASSSPCLYWFAAEYALKHIQRKNITKTAILTNRKELFAWFFGYFVIGTILFCNFLPFT